MDDPRISGFNADEVRAGLMLAMNVGTPPDPKDRPQFHISPGANDLGDITDAAGVPLDWRSGRAPALADKVVTVPCAVESFDREGQPSGFGPTTPFRVLITLLDEHYEQVKGFHHVVLGGIRYKYVHTLPPLGLVSIGVWQIHCLADDEG